MNVVRAAIGFLARPAAIGALVILGACASRPNGIGEGEHETIRVANLYRYGPAQSAVPEILPAGTLVNVMAEDCGYAKVVLSDNRTGYVAGEDLQPLPEVRKAEPLAELEGQSLFVETELPTDFEPDFSQTPEEVLFASLSSPPEFPSPNPQQTKTNK